jgi:transposase
MLKDDGKAPIREVRALEMLRDGERVSEVSDHEFIVGSQSGRGFYRVKIGQDKGPTETCTCPDFEERVAACKHIYVVRHWLKAAEAGNPNPLHPLSQPPAKRAAINWTAYNEYQVEEYRLFNTLLRELSIGFPEPEKDPHLAGRKPIPLREQVFCAVQKTYLGFSCRRSNGFRDQAAKNGLISKTPFWAVPSRFLCRNDVTGALHEMLARSAIPLMGIEDRCAIDSTGLRTTRFNYYRHEKYEPSRENDWRKLHALVGVKTHVIPVLEVTDGPANDSPQFPILLKRAVANGFQFKEVYADKGYVGRENCNVASELGVLPFIPFKSNNTGVSRGSPMYHKMFLFFQYHREEFDRHYGQRAQVEATFGAFKQKFGETLASRKFDSQVNEILCMAIAFNITMVVRQMFEAGVFPEFLRPPSGQGATPRPLSGAALTPLLSLNPGPSEPPVIQSDLSR